MPLGECNGHYRCDSCNRPMKKGTEAWIDIEENEIICLPCHNGEAIPALPPVPAAPSGPKTVVVRHESSKVDDLKKENAALKRENRRLKVDIRKLRNHARELLELSKRIRGKGKKPDLTLTDERLRLRGK